MKYFLFFLFSVSLVTGHAQDVFQKELFSIEQIQKFKDEINLSDEQLKEIRAIYNGNIGVYNNLKWDLDAEYAKMKKELEKVDLDSETSMTQMEKVLAIETELKKQRLSTLISMRNQLNSAQQQKLKELIKDDGYFPSNIVTPINENPRVSIKVDGSEKKQPIYVVIDSSGEKEVSNIEDINPDDIESINVYKGSSAIDVFGIKGKNGVVELRLKGAPKEKERKNIKKGSIIIDKN